MNHQIKINRAAKLAPKLPMAAREIWKSIPESLTKSLSAKELAQVVNALDSHWHRSGAHKEKEIINEGCVWSDKRNALLDVVLPNA